MNLALTGMMAQCQVGATILALCEFGHAVITAGVSKLYTKKINGVAVDRGMAFPVCISVNDVVCHHSPLVEEERVRSVSWMLSIRRVVVIVYMFVLLRVCGWAGLDHKRTKETLRQTHTQKNLLWSYQVRHDCMPLCEHHSESSVGLGCTLTGLTDRVNQVGRERLCVLDSD